MYPRWPTTLRAAGGLGVGLGYVLFADGVDQPRLPKYLLAHLL